MSSSGPFAPLALSAGVCTNIATEILKQHAQKFAGTLLGRMLQHAKLLEPTFHDRLHETVSQTLQVYFETHPQYALTGIRTFFCRPEIAQALGDYILDRTPLDQAQLHQALARWLDSEGIALALLHQCEVDPAHILPDFLHCFRRVVRQHLSVAQLASC